jgi:hypothetical protein
MEFRPDHISVRTRNLRGFAAREGKWWSHHYQNTSCTQSTEGSITIFYIMEILLAIDCTRVDALRCRLISSW